MPKGRLTLDNPVFSETLRRPRPSVSYESRALHPSTMQDVMGVRARSVTQAQPKNSLPANTAQFKPAQPIRQDYNQANLLSAHNRASAITEKEMVTPEAPTTEATTGGRSKSMVYGLYASAITVFAFGLAVAYNGFAANNKVTSQVKALEATQSTDETGAVNGGPPSTQKPSAKAIRNYTVSPVNPRYIEIPALKSKARVLTMTVDRKNELQAPYGIYDAGWYSSSSRPGENGAMLIDGHSGLGKTNGIFHNISKLPIGAEIRVTRGDGKIFTYLVVKKEIVDAKKVNMGSLLVSQNTAKPGLNLITCTGSQEPGTFTLTQRAIVYAVQK